MATRTRTTCPFCLNGCESEVVFNYQYRMEYPADAAVNRGRLCPRGNSASIVLDHPKRLGYPLLDGVEVTWDRALNYCREALSAAGATGTAVGYSRGLAEAELDLVWGFARAVSTPLLFCGYLEPGNSFGRKLAGTRAAALDDVRQAKVTLLAGDVFATSPVAAGPITESRYADRKNRLIVIDSLRTGQSGFAHLFIQVRPGTEAFALLGIAAVLDSKLGLDVASLSAAAGVERGQLEAAANMLKSGPAFVGSAMGLGRTAMPTLHSFASQLAAVSAGAAFTGFTEGLVRPAPTEFSAFRKAAGERRVRALFWFGSLHPLSYPELLPEAGEIEYQVATSIFRPTQPLRGLLLPVPSELEKESSGRSYWGEVQRRPLAAPFSGARSVGRILSDLATVSPVAAPPQPAAGTDAVLELARAELVRYQVPKGPVLLGEKLPIGIGGFYRDETDAGIGLGAELTGSGEDALLRTGTAERRLRPRRSAGIPNDVVVVRVNAHANRALFRIGDDGAGAPAIPPVSVEVSLVPGERSLPVEKVAV